MTAGQYAAAAALSVLLLLTIALVSTTLGDTLADRWLERRRRHAADRHARAFYSGRWMG